MGECTDTTEELAEEMRRIGRFCRWPTYYFSGSLFGVADRLESLQAELRTLRADKERLDGENQALRAELERRRQQRMSARLVGRPSGVRPAIPVQAHLLLDLAAAAGLECEQEPDQILLHATRALRAAIDAAKEET